MDFATARLLYRLSFLVVALVLLVTGLVVGVQLPMARELSVVGILGSLLAIALIMARLARRRDPGSRLASLAPEVIVPRTIRGTRELAGSARARRSATAHRHKRHARVLEAERAAVEAAETDPGLAAASIRTAADALVRLVYLALEERDTGRLATLAGPELVSSWERSLVADENAGRRTHTRIVGDVDVELVDLNALPGAGTTAVVLVEAVLDNHVEDRDGRRIPAGRSSRSARAMCQYWTLSRGTGPWTVQAIEERDEGDHHLRDAPIS